MNRPNLFITSFDELIHHIVHDSAWLMWLALAVLGCTFFVIYTAPHYCPRWQWWGKNILRNWLCLAGLCYLVTLLLNVMGW